MYRKFLISGTLGDCYVILRKLQDYLKCKNLDERNCYVSYASDTIEHHSLIKEMFQELSYLNFSEEVLMFDDNTGLKSIIDQFSGEFLNHTWNGLVFESEKVQACDAKIDTFSQLGKQISSGAIKVGLQVHSGKKNKNEKVIHHSFVNKLVMQLKQYNFEVYLFGTDKSFVQKINNNDNLYDLVGELNFNNWLENLRDMNFLVTPEGFPLFYALDHNVQCIGFYEYNYIFDRIPPHWRNNGIFYCSRNHTIYSRLNRRIRKSLSITNFVHLPPPESIANHIINKFAYL